MKRVSEQRTIQRASRNSNFSIDILINEAIKKGEWRTNIWIEGLTAGETKGLIVEHYDLDEFVADRLEFSFIKYTQGGNEKREVVEDDERMTGATVLDKEGNQKILTIDDIQLFVKLEKGDKVDEDISCDSTFMLTIMPMIADKMREAFKWVPETEKVFLVMDNAGGHGTKEAIKQYIEILRQRRIEVVWQVPRSPETNMLDLGVWMSIQTAVCKVQQNRRCKHDVLAKSVEDAWSNYLNEEAFKNVWGRLRVVLVFIVEGGGSNDEVESRRGKLFRDATIADKADDPPPSAADLSSSFEFEDDLTDVDSLPDL